MKRIFTLTGLVILIAANVLAQSANRNEALETFNRGDINRAIPMLESALKQNGADAEILNALGMSHAQKKEGKKAAKYFLRALQAEPANNTYRVNLSMVYLIDKEYEKAMDEVQGVIAKDPNNAAAYLVRGKILLADKKEELAERDANTVLSIEPSSALAHSLKADAVYQLYLSKIKATGNWKENVEMLRAAIDTLRSCLQNCKNNGDRTAQEDRLAIINAFYEAGKHNGAGDAEVTPDYKPLTILKKFAPGYRDQSRANHTQGSVRLLVLFGADGTIPLVIILKNLASDLDKAAVGAAFKIQFQPALKSGKPVPTVRAMEYHFEIY